MMLSSSIITTISSLNLWGQSKLIRKVYNLHSYGENVKKNMSEMKDSKLLYMFDQGHTADETSLQSLLVACKRYVCMNNPKKSSLRLLFHELKIDSKIWHCKTAD